MSDLNSYFIYRCEKGLQERGLLNKVEYRDRLRHEMETIIDMGFPGYFLIVQDFITWAKSNGIYVGPGRGSVAGSLASYCLRITELDPIRWGLLFERFLNPGRKGSLCDIDVDFETKHRGRVIDYVAQKYGTDKVAHIGTFNKQRAKAAIRNVTKLLGHPYAVGDHLAKLTLPPIHGKPQSLSASMERVPELHAYKDTKSTQGEILRWAEKAEDRISSVGVHASGVVISNESLLDTVPLFRGNDEEITTQWEMNNIEEVGLIKFDFLGLDALEKIHNCIDLVQQRHNISIDINTIDLDDEQTYANLRAGDSVGIFQLEASSGMRDLLVQIRPTSLEDIILLVAVYRPGPLSCSYKDTYLEIRAGRDQPHYLVPDLEPILSRTSGWIVYQEQIIEIAKQLCRYTASEADELRKAVGKKKQSLMDKHEVKFKTGWQEHGLSEDTANQIWRDINEFASYSFNKSHAAAYAYITYQTAWLKTHYPLEFMCAIMTSDARNRDQMIKYLAECKRLGIQVLPPDINRSTESFHISDDGHIRFGLGPVKNLGAQPVSFVIEERQHRPYSSLRDFCERVDLGMVNRLKLESLIKAGAFDSFGQSRAAMVAMVEAIWNYREEVKKYTTKMETYRRKLDQCVQRKEDIEAGKTSSTGKKLKPLKEPTRPEEPQWPADPELDEAPSSQVLSDEHKLLGFYVSSHPLDSVKDSLTYKYSTVEDIKQMNPKTNITLAAVITNYNEITTSKSKKKMAFVSLEDMTGSIEGVCFPNVYTRVRDTVQSEETRPIEVTGTVEVTEADEGRVVKIMVKNIRQLDLSIDDQGERIEATVPAERAKWLLNALDKYHGDLHEVHITLEAKDGTKLRVPKVVKIGNYRGAFMRELTRICNGNE